MQTGQSLGELNSSCLLFQKFSELLFLKSFFDFRFELILNHFNLLSHSLFEGIFKEFHSDIQFGVINDFIIDFDIVGLHSDLHRADDFFDFHDFIFDFEHVLLAQHLVWQTQGGAFLLVIRLFFVVLFLFENRIWIVVERHILLCWKIIKDKK